MANMLVLGMGDTLPGDAGLGARAARRLQECYELPEEALVIEGSWPGLALLPYLEGATHLLLLGAVHTGRPAGSLVRLEGAEIPLAAPMPHLTPTEQSLENLLWAARALGLWPQQTVLWGMERSSRVRGYELSSPVATNLGALVARAAGQLRAWGIEPVRTHGFAGAARRVALDGHVSICPQCDRRIPAGVGA